MLIQELRVSLNTTPILWCDNLGALSLATNLVFHVRTKHIDVDYYFIREKVINRDIITKYLPTIDQVVNIFTKGLTSACFLLLRNKLRVTTSLISLQEDVEVHLAENKGSNGAAIEGSDGGLVSGLTEGQLDYSLQTWKDKPR